MGKNGVCFKLKSTVTDLTGFKFVSNSYIIMINNQFNSHQRAEFTEQKTVPLELTILEVGGKQN